MTARIKSDAPLSAAGQIPTVLRRIRPICPNRLNCVYPMVYYDHGKRDEILRGAKDAGS